MDGSFLLQIRSQVGNPEGSRGPPSAFHAINVVGLAHGKVSNWHEQAY